MKKYQLVFRALGPLLAVGALSLFVSCDTGGAGPKAPRAISDYLTRYMPDFTRQMPASLSASGGSPKAKALYDGSGEPVVKTASALGVFGGYYLQYGGFDYTVLLYVNGIKEKLIALDPEENAVTTLGSIEVDSLGNIFTVDLGKAKWFRRPDGSAIVCCYIESTGGNGTLKMDFSFTLSSMGFTLNLIQENPDGDRYVVAKYDNSSKAYFAVAYDSALGPNPETDYQIFVGEPLEDGSFRFSTRQWNDGHKDAPVHFGLGLATSSFAGFVAFFDDKDINGVGRGYGDGVIDQSNSSAGDGYREEYYNASGDSVYISKYASSGDESLTDYFGLDVNSRSSYYRLGYMNPTSQGATLAHDADTDEYFIVDGELSTPLAISLSVGVSGAMGGQDAYGMITYTLEPDIPYTKAGASLVSIHEGQIAATRAELTLLKTSWVDKLDFADYQAAIDGIPDLSLFADLKDQPG